MKELSKGGDRRSVRWKEKKGSGQGFSSEGAKNSHWDQNRGWMERLRRNRSPQGRKGGGRKKKDGGKRFGAE